MIEANEWAVFRVAYQTYIPSLWLRDQFIQPNKNESGTHRRLKLVAAEFLRYCGHNLPTIENPDRTGVSPNNRGYVFTGECFEQHYGAGIADVCCPDSQCNVYAEVGSMAAEKIHRAATSVDTLVRLPYGASEDLNCGGSEYSIYLFQRLSDEAVGD